MNNDFRQRVFLPIIMPLGAVVGFFGFAFMLSRVLLAVEESASVWIALLIALYILAIAAVIAARPRITSRALAVGTTLGIIAVVAAGTVGAAVGIREIEHHGTEEAAPEGGEQGGVVTAPGSEAAEAAEGAATDPNQLSFTAEDIKFTTVPETTKAGEKQVTLVNAGQTPHNVTFPDLGDAPIVEAEGGETATGSVTLDPGTYEFICSVPGHDSLMSGELTVE